MVAVASTVLAIPMLLVEIADGADASPDQRPVAFVAAEIVESISPQLPEIALAAGADGVDVADAPAPDAPKAIVSLSGDELAAPRLLGVFGGGDELRAQAEAEEEAAVELARQAEEERLRRVEEREAAEEAERKAEQDRIAAERAAEQQARVAAAEAQPASESPPAGGPSAAQWQALRQCESGNNYRAISPNKLYYGAYQFYTGTWDNTARNAGRTDLVGVRPDQASPADQDALAFALYQSRGHRPWPHCGAHLR